MIDKKLGIKDVLKDDFRKSIDYNVSIATKEFQINEYLTVKLENDKTNIYVNREYFSHCKFLLLEIPTEDPYRTEEIESIDEAAEKLDRSLEGQKNKYLIPPEIEFWGHCSNLQAWAENEYDTRLLHRSIAFYLLKRLMEVGDPKAKKVFKKEIIERFMSNYIPIKMYLIEDGYIAYLDLDLIKYILENCRAMLPASYISYIQKSISSKWNDIAIFYTFNGQYDEAINICKQIITLFPNDFDSWENLGSGFMEKKEYQNAFKAYKKALKLKKDGIILKELAYLYFLRKDYNKAFSFGNFAVKIYPELKFSWKKINMYYHRKGKLIRSIISYVKKYIKNPKIRFRLYFNLKIMEQYIRGYFSNEL